MMGRGKRGGAIHVLTATQGPTLLVLGLQRGQTILSLLLPPPFQQFLIGFFRDIIIWESA